jgi:hypothetical protein
MPGVLDFFDPATYSSAAPSGILPPWLTQTISGLQSGPSMLQAFPPARLPMAPGSYPIPGSSPGTSPVAGATQPPQQRGDIESPAAPAAPSSSGLLPALSSSAAASAAPASSPSPGSGSGAGIGDRLLAALMGFTHGGGALPAIGNLVGGLVTGERQDPQGMMLAHQAATLRALRSAGIPNPEAITAMHPAMARTLLAHAYRRSP